jgi:hypothetical protein
VKVCQFTAGESGATEHAQCFPGVLVDFEEHGGAEVASPVSGGISYWKRCANLVASGLAWALDSPFVIDPHIQLVGQPANVDGIAADHGIQAARIAFFEHMHVLLSVRTAKAYANAAELTGWTAHQPRCFEPPTSLYISSRHVRAWTEQRHERSSRKGVRQYHRRRGHGQNGTVRA